MSAPYISDSEVIYDPIGINWANIPKAGATTQEQVNARARLIQQATSRIDARLQMGLTPVAGFLLSATREVEVFALSRAGGRRARMMPDGTFRVFTRYLPIARDVAGVGQVTSIVSMQYSPDGINYTTLGFTAIPEGSQTLRLVPPGSWTWSFAGNFGAPNYGWLKITLDAGFPNTTLNGASTSGATTLALNDVTGIQPGEILTIYDGPQSDETVTVASTWIPLQIGAGTVPLTSPTLYNHATGLACSALPAVVRQATQMQLVDIVRARGSDAVTQGSAGRGKPVGANKRYGAPGQGAEIEEMLQPFVRQI